MSTSVTFNGTAYTVPAIGDASWGTNVSNYLIAIASGCLQKSGGCFTLTAEVNFGATYGLKGPYYKGPTATPSTTGIVRLAKTDNISWRNNANSADLPLGIDASDVLQYNSISLVDLSSVQTLTNKSMSGSANTFTNMPSSAITGTLGADHGGTGVANNIASTLTISGSFGTTFTVTGATALTLPTSGTLATHSDKLSAFAATSSAELAGVISDETGTGALVFANTPTLVTPVLGVATATSVNKLAITAPATGSTLAVVDGKTFTVSNTLTLAGTDGNTITFPSGSATVLTVTGTQSPTNKTYDSSSTMTGIKLASLTPDGTHTLTMPSSTDTLVGKATTDTLTNKTLTSPAVTGLTGTLANITGFGLRDTSAAFDVTLAATSSTTISAGRTITIDCQNASKTIKITPLSNFSTLADGTAGQILSTLGTNTGYAWASALSSTLNQYCTLVGDSSNVAQSADTNLLGNTAATYVTATVTMTIAAPCVVTYTSHGMATGDKFYLTTTGALPTGLTASTTYYVNKVDANTFNVSTTFANARAGTNITTSGSQSGTHSIFKGGLNTAIIPGNDGSTAITAGYIGEEKHVASTATANSSTFVTTASLTLTVGTWWVSCTAACFDTGTSAIEIAFVDKGTVNSALGDGYLIYPGNATAGSSGALGNRLITIQSSDSTKTAGVAIRLSGVTGKTGYGYVSAIRVQ